jgi:hypothetical protein
MVAIVSHFVVNQWLPLLTANGCHSVGHSVDKLTMMSVKCNMDVVKESGIILVSR